MPSSGEEELVVSTVRELVGQGLTGTEVLRRLEMVVGVVMATVVRDPQHDEATWETFSANVRLVVAEQRMATRPRN